MTPPVLTARVLAALQAMVRGIATNEQVILLAKNGIRDTHRAHLIWSQIKSENGVEEMRRP